MDCGKLTRIARSPLLAGALGTRLHGLDGLGGASADRLPRPRCASVAGRRLRDPGRVAMQASSAARGSIVRLYLYWRAVAGQTARGNFQRHRSQATTGTRTTSRTTSRRRQNNGLTRHAHDPLRARLGAARRARRRGTHNPDPAKLKPFTRAAVAALPAGRYLGCLERAELQAFLSPQYRNGKLVSPTMYRALLNAAASVDPRRYPEQGRRRRDRALLALELEGQAHRARPAALPAQAALRGQVAGTPTCKTNVHADIFATHPYTSGNAFHHAFNANDVSFGDLPRVEAV